MSLYAMTYKSDKSAIKDLFTYNYETYSNTTSHYDGEK
jgi:hypothetical protein